MALVLTVMFLSSILGTLNEVVCIRESSALDAFKMFYEELIPTDPSNNRIRRLRSTGTVK